ncbi:MAG: hypothetical protein RDV48_25035 [Candidatus Eremiobacteraeota bacterium]|nr:hypothetical protein [Candidatus Eremiobacteraeota bacterium]
MNQRASFRQLRGTLAAFAAFFCMLAPPGWCSDSQAFITQPVIESTVKSLAAKAEGESPRVRKGVAAAARLWRHDDGDSGAFTQFCLDNFVTDEKERERFLARCEQNLETLDGCLHEISRQFNEAVQLDKGPIMAIDRLFSSYSTTAHLSDDFFSTKTAFSILLNFPPVAFEELQREGPRWSRRQWAEARLSDRYMTRVPASVSAKVSLAYTKAQDYVYNYKIYMGKLRMPGGSHPFPEDLRLISHWGLRDELKSLYGDKDGMARQELIVKVMERIIRQEIPGAIVNSEAFEWDPYGNILYKDGRAVEGKPEAKGRYHHLREIFKSAELVDPFVPERPTLIKRTFEVEMEIPESVVESYLVQVLSSPQVKRTARLIEKRLGRKLRPFDIWYPGLRPVSSTGAEELDGIVEARYPTVASFQADLPHLLRKLGFTRDKAEFLASHIVVDPARGAGHSSGAERRSDCAHLRTPFVAGKMNYEGFNTAMHELGHSVEQVFSLNGIDHTLLAGVPNTAFTEAFAFLFETHDRELLGQAPPPAGAGALATLDTLWSTYEIAGVSLVSMKAWHWMYDHPSATEAEIGEAVIAIAREVWNTYFAPVLGERDSILLAVYSHMIYRDLYLPNYPIGYLIQFQLGQYLEGKDLAAEMERMCIQGCLTPDLWMRLAVGAPISPEPLLSASEKALHELGE